MTIWPSLIGKTNNNKNMFINNVSRLQTHYSKYRAAGCLWQQGPIAAPLHTRNSTEGKMATPALDRHGPAPIGP